MTNVSTSGAMKARRKEGLTLPKSFKSFEEAFTEEVTFKLSPAD